MKRLPVLALLLALLPAISLARDWQALIVQLESQPRTDANSQQIAVCCNNLALDCMREKKWNKAERWLKKAIDMHRDPIYETHLSSLYLHQAYDLYHGRSSKSVGGKMHQRSKLMAKRALAFDKNNAEAHVLVGRIEYDNQKLLQAKRALQAAKRINPRMDGIDGLLAKVEREMKVEKKFKKSSNSFFEVRYQNSVDAETANGLKLAMETARDVVGRDFTYRPKHKLVLLVYSSKSFSNLNLGPHWAAGLYDGKIRLPLDGKSNLKQAVCTLFHEYTHAIIHDLSKGNCPKWLNEGLADVQGSKVDPRGTWALEAAWRQGNLLALGDLSAAFQSSHDLTVDLAYQQSYSVARFMTETYGYKRVRRLIDDTGQEVPMELALRRRCGVSTEQLEAAWKDWVPTMWEK